METLVWVILGIMGASVLIANLTGRIFTTKIRRQIAATNATAHDLNQCREKIMKGIVRRSLVLQDDLGMFNTKERRII